MDKAISPTNTPQEDAHCSILEEQLRFPWKGVSASEPDTQGVVLHSALQPHFLNSGFYGKGARSVTA